jgi:hypothetical protein
MGETESTTALQIDIDDRDALFQLDLIPSKLSTKSLPAVYNDLTNDLPYRTVLVLVQLELTDSNWGFVTSQDIYNRHGRQFTQEEYLRRLQSLTERGLLAERGIGPVCVYRLPDGCKPAAVFSDDNVEFVTPSTEMDRSRFGPLRVLTSIAPRWFDNQYVSVGEILVVFVVFNLLFLLGTGSFGPISETAPRVIFAWALLSFAISALAVGSVLAVFKWRRTD